MSEKAIREQTVLEKWNNHAITSCLREEDTKPASQASGLPALFEYYNALKPNRFKTRGGKVCLNITKLESYTNMKHR